MGSSCSIPQLCAAFKVTKNSIALDELKISILFYLRDPKKALHTKGSINWPTEPESSSQGVKRKILQMVTEVLDTLDAERARKEMEFLEHRWTHLGMTKKRKQ